MKKIKKDKKGKKCACKKPCTKCKCEGEVGEVEVKRKRGRPRKVMGDSFESFETRRTSDLPAGITLAFGQQGENISSF